MKAIIALLAGVFFLNCGKDVRVVTPTDGIARLPRIGNVEITLDFDAIGGKSISVSNGNDRAVGVYVVKNDEPSIIVFSDGYIGKHGSSTHRGTNFEYGWELKVTVVIYNSLAGGFEAFIDALGLDFLDKIKNVWIEEKYEEIVVIKRP